MGRDALYLSTCLTIKGKIGPCRKRARVSLRADKDPLWRTVRRGSDLVRPKFEREGIRMTVDDDDEAIHFSWPLTVPADASPLLVELSARAHAVNYEAVADMLEQAVFFGANTPGRIVYSTLNESAEEEEEEEEGDDDAEPPSIISVILTHWDAITLLLGREGVSLMRGGDDTIVFSWTA
jgi:hypothetical protein